MGNLVSDLGAGRQLIETHISWVFLGEHDVYKVKKPVDLEFLDFTKLSERKRLCEVEVQLNQRLSHDVYLGVVPVVRDASGQHRILHEQADEQAQEQDNATPTTNDTVVDYAVHMRRLFEHQRFDVLLSKDELSRSTVQRFAEHLAHFHARCDIKPELEQLGTADAIRGNVDQNFRQLGGAIEAHLPRAQATALPIVQRDFLSQHSTLFSERIANGKVRDGHGDLRLEHVYATPTGLQVLDCIEFSDRFRYADVCADVAFITMDLRHHGRADLAEALVAAYTAETCDYQLYALLNFYESYRAVVRAKVNYLALAAPGAEPKNTPEAHAEIRRYLTQGFEAFRGRERTPRVIAVGGLIASGKSHTANTIGAQLCCPVIATDRLRKHLHQAHAHQTLGTANFDGAYSETATANTYAALLGAALHVLHSGRSVILDGTFRSRVERQRVVDFCQTNGVPLYFVECTADEATLRQRLQQREHQTSISDAREQLLDDFIRRYQAPTTAEVGQLCRLNTTEPEGEQMRMVTQFLNG